MELHVLSLRVILIAINMIGAHGANLSFGMSCLAFWLKPTLNPFATI